MSGFIANLLAFSFLHVSQAQTVKVAVIDTGFDFVSDWSGAIAVDPSLKKPKICKDGHEDFTGTGIKDNHGHGTHIAGLIAQYAGDSDYCLIVMKFHDPAGEAGNSLKNTLKAFQKAIDLKVEMINYSGGGMDVNPDECKIIVKALDQGIIVVAAAGNESSNINKTKFYPAMCDRRVKVVANINKDGTYGTLSNFTDNKKNSVFLYKEVGMDAMSLLPDNSAGCMTGTSQATAILTGKIANSFRK